MTRELWCERNESAASAHGHTADCYRDIPAPDERQAGPETCPSQTGHDHTLEGGTVCRFCGHRRELPAPAPDERQAGLRERVWAAQHDATCDDGKPHPWTDHLPWEGAEDEQTAIREADAIIAEVLEDVAERVRGLQIYGPMIDGDELLALFSDEGSGK